MSGEYMLTEYTKKKIHAYADSLLELSRCYSTDKVCTGDGDRRERLEWESKKESSLILGDYLRDISVTIEQMAQEAFGTGKLLPKQEKRLKMQLKKEGLEVQDVFTIEREGKGMTHLGLILFSRRKGGHPKKEVADLLSVLLKNRLTPSVETPQIIGEKEILAMFVPEPRYFVMQGIARAIKDGEQVSGDAFSVMERENGEVTAILSDGMGCGEKAARDSAQVLDYMERLLETGFGPKRAMESVNRLLISQGEENMSTLDVCNINLVRGLCSFFKVGGVCSFLKSGSYVEKIENPSLPLGLWIEKEQAFYGIDMPVVERELVDGDYIIMLTDGAVDALQNCSYEDGLLHYLEGLRQQHPREMAERLLQFVLHLCGGKVEDDMTILVLGIFDGNR